jgi:hypothetical protein
MGVLSCNGDPIQYTLCLRCSTRFLSIRFRKPEIISKNSKIVVKIGTGELCAERRDLWWFKGGKRVSQWVRIYISGLHKYMVPEALSAFNVIDKNSRTEGVAGCQTQMSTWSTNDNPRITSKSHLTTSQRTLVIAGNVVTYQLGRDRPAHGWSILHRGVWNPNLTVSRTIFRFRGVIRQPSKSRAD